MKKIVLAIDIQNEYITEGRPFSIKGINESLQKKQIYIVGFDGGANPELGGRMKKAAAVR